MTAATPISEYAWDQSIAKIVWTGSIGGSPVAGGASATGTVSMPGASALLAYNSSYQAPSGGTLQISPAFAGGPGAGFVWQAYLDGSTTDQIDVEVTNVTSGSLTPTAGIYCVTLLWF
jgi:hypothetical protein